MPALPYRKEKVFDNGATCCYAAAAAGVDEATAAELLSRLPPDEQETYRRYRQPGSREMFLCSRSILREELARRGLPHDAKIAFGEHQKPFLERYPERHFNVSHSAGAVMVGFSERPLGVDIERMVSLRGEQLVAIAGRVFHEAEVALLLRQPVEAERRRLFTKLWTLKESIVKALGVGFYADTKAIEVPDVEHARQGEVQVGASRLRFHADAYTGACGEAYLTAVAYIAAP